MKHLHLPKKDDDYDDWKESASPKLFQVSLLLNCHQNKGCWIYDLHGTPYHWAQQAPTRYL